MKNNETVDVANIYKLDGRVPIGKAIPFGLQHILAMFVSNLTPITIIAAAGGLGKAEVAILLQNAMFVAGIATLIQLYPIWKIGSRLPIVMGVSFTFVTVLSTVAANYGYPAVIGAVLVGGILEGTLGIACKILEKNYFSDRGSFRCNSNRIFFIYCRVQDHLDAAIQRTLVQQKI